MIILSVCEKILMKYIKEALIKFHRDEVIGKLLDKN